MPDLLIVTVWPEAQVKEAALWSPSENLLSRMGVETSGVAVFQIRARPKVPSVGKAPELLPPIPQSNVLLANVPVVSVSASPNCTNPAPVSVKNVMVEPSLMTLKLPSNVPVSRDAVEL